VKSGAQSGAVTLRQRSGSALNLNLHFHILCLNGIYDGQRYFLPVQPPTTKDLNKITQTISRPVARHHRCRYYLSVGLRAESEEEGPGVTGHVVGTLFFRDSASVPTAGVIAVIFLRILKCLTYCS
jgi:hypothetical protein